MILDGARFRACCRGNLLPFYQLFDRTVKELRISPLLLFNLDETNINFTQRDRSKVIVSRTSPITVSVAPDRTSSATLVLCIPAEGRSLDCTLIWPQVHIPSEFCSFSAKGIRIYPQKTAYQTSKSFDSMMIDYYLPAMIERRHILHRDDDYILLIMDGHTTRMSVSVIHFARQNRIIILILPSHTSSVTQPLDRAPNAALKQVFTSKVTELLSSIGNSSQESRVDSSTIESSEEGKRNPDEGEIRDTLKNDLEEEGEVLYPPLPQEILFSPGRNQFMGSATANRQLLLEVLPFAVEAATRYSVMRAGWQKSGLFPFNPEIACQGLPIGEKVPEPQRDSPIISGCIVTEVEKLAEICRYKESRMVKELKRQTGDEDRKEIMKMQLKEIRRILGEMSGEGGEVSKVGDQSMMQEGGEVSKLADQHLLNTAPTLPSFQAVRTLLLRTDPASPAPVLPFQHAPEFPTLHDSTSSVVLQTSDLPEFTEIPKRRAHDEEYNDISADEQSESPVPVPPFLRRSTRPRCVKKMPWDMMGW